MGMSKSEMQGKFEEIFEFAELSRFRNMKLKNFSSGMYARLANEVMGVLLTMSTGEQVRCEGGWVKGMFYLL